MLETDWEEVIKTFEEDLKWQQGRLGIGEGIGEYIYKEWLIHYRGDPKGVTQYLSELKL